MNLFDQQHIDEDEFKPEPNQGPEAKVINALRESCEEIFLKAYVHLGITEELDSLVKNVDRENFDNMPLIIDKIVQERTVEAKKNLEDIFDLSKNIKIESTEPAVAIQQLENRFT